MENLSEIASVIDELVIVIVIYKTSLADSSTFRTLPEAAAYPESKLDVIIYDNSPEPSEVPPEERLNILYIHNSENPGISKAYNEAAKIGLDRGKKWILFFDQDTTLSNKSITCYAEAILANKKIMLFAPVLVSSEGNIISPVLFKKRMGYSPKQINYGENSLSKRSPVNSGLCVSLSLFSDVGGYNEAIPLDYSDYDFIDRVKLKTTFFFIVDLELQHELSASETPSLISSLTRFRYLCIGLKQSSKSRSDVFFSLLVGLKRAAKLTVVYKNVRFFKILFDEFY